MVTISLCMIVKNEERVLGRCLESVQEIADEIIIVDTGSEDRTKEIAEKYHARVYEQEWQDDFSRARNYSFSRAEMDYCMWLDADDVLLYEDNKKLEQLKENLDVSVDMVIMRYNMSFDKDDKNAKQNLINSVVYTMTQFTEINSVKFLVDGVENEELK